MRKIPLALLCARGVFFVSHGIVFSLTEVFFIFLTEVFFSHGSFFYFTRNARNFFRQRLKDRWFTEFTLRVPFGFELSPTDCTD